MVRVTSTSTAMMLPFILWLRESLPAGSTDRSLLFLILYVHQNVTATTGLIPRISTAFTIEHALLTVSVVLVARLEEVSEGEESRVTNGANNGGVSLPSSPNTENGCPTI
jgi:hypothetical protein